MSASAPPITINVAATNSNATATPSPSASARTPLAARKVYADGSPESAEATYSSRQIPLFQQGNEKLKKDAQYTDIRIQDVSVHQIPRLHDFLPNLPSYPNRFARTKSTIRAGIVTASSHHHHGHQPAGPFQLSRGIKAGVPQSELAQQHHLHHPPEEVQYSQFIKEGDVVLLDIVRRSGLGPGGAKSFIRAGPREEIVWAPGEAVAAIVTCGGLCPGLNDVIAELFNTLFYNYGVNRIHGIRSGFRGFWDPQCFPWLDLTPDCIRGIDSIGGTVLGSSRGGFDLEKIMQACINRGVNQLYIVGGDGTHRAADLIQHEARRRKVKMTVACVPKTIDNDIGVIDRSFGFNTAVAEARKAIQSAVVEATCCLAPSTRVRRYDGKDVTIDTIEVGDCVVSTHGQPALVKHIQKGEVELMYKITYNGGEHLVTPNHLVTLIWTRSNPEVTLSNDAAILSWYDSKTYQYRQLSVRLSSNDTEAAHDIVLPLEVSSPSLVRQYMWSCCAELERTGLISPLRIGDLFDVKASELKEFISTKKDSKGVWAQLPIMNTADSQLAENDNSHESAVDEMHAAIPQSAQESDNSADIHLCLSSVLNQFVQSKGLDLSHLSANKAEDDDFFNIDSITPSVQSEIRRLYSIGVPISKIYTQLHGTEFETSYDLIQLMVRQIVVEQQIGAESTDATHNLWQAATEATRQFKNARKIGDGMAFESVSQGDQIDAVYMLPNPDVESSMFDRDSHTLRSIGKVWSQLNLTTEQLNRVMISELNTVNVDDTMDSVYEPVFKAAMDAALSVSPKVIVAFGKFAHRRWLAECKNLTNFDSVELKFDDETGEESLNITLIADSDPIRVIFAQHPACSNGFNDVVNKLAAAHSISDDVTQAALNKTNVMIPIADVKELPGRQSFIGLTVTGGRFVLADGVLTHNSPNGLGIVQLMGRHAGYIAAHATLASRQVDMCLIPEITFPLEGPYGVLAQTEQILARQGYGVIVVAEGAGIDLLPTIGTDPSGNKKLPEIGKFLQSEIVKHFAKKKIDVSIKYHDPSYMIRSVPADASDSVYCMTLAQNAVHGAMAGLTGFTSGLVNNRTVLLPIPVITATSPSYLNPEGRTWERVLSLTHQPSRIWDEIAAEKKQQMEATKATMAAASNAIASASVPTPASLTVPPAASVAASFSSSATAPAP